MKLKKILICFCFLTFGICLFAVDTVKVGYYRSSNFLEGCADNVIKSGYAYEYLQEVAAYTGWKYKYVYGDWSTLYDKFISGEIDIMPGFSKTDDREKLCNFPKIPMGIEFYYLYKLSENYEITPDELKTLNGKKIGAIRENLVTIYLKDWIKKNNINCEVVLFDSFGERDRALNSKKIDLLVATNNNVGAESGWSPLHKIGESSYYLAVSKNKTNILNQLNSSLQNLFADKPFLVQNLQAKYFNQTAVNSSLSSAELDWMYSHRKLVIGYINEYIPFSYSENGRVTGLITDIAREFFVNFKLTDKIRIELKGFDSFEELISEVQKGSVDIAFPVYDSFWYSEQLGLMQTDSFTTVVMDLLYTDDTEEDLTRKIAVNKNDFYQYIYTQIYYPDSELIFVESDEACLKAVLAGEATSTVFNSFKCIHFLGSHKYTKMKSYQLSKGISYAAGVKSGNTILLSLVNRGLMIIDKDSITNSLYQYAGSNVYSSFSDILLDNIYQIVIIVFVILVIITLAIISYIKILRKSNKKILASELKLQTQLDIVNALSHDYLNVYLVNAEEKKVKIMKMDGYITEGFEKGSEKTYPYQPMCNQYIADRVYKEDKENVHVAMSLENVLDRLSEKNEYVYSYRIIENEEIHYCQFKYIRLEDEHPERNIIVGFQNIDSIVEAAREKESLKKLSETDMMTKLYNRGYGEKKISEMLARGERGLFCLLDVDHFKTINDTFGHSVGDKVLTEVSSALKSAFRAEDIVFRLGGDEFGVFAPGIVEREQGKTLIQNFFKQLEKISIPEMGNHKISASMGALIATEDYEVNFQTLYKLVDVCVYDSKEVIGNAVNFFPAE